MQTDKESAVPQGTPSAPNQAAFYRWSLRELARLRKRHLKIAANPLNKHPERNLDHVRTIYQIVERRISMPFRSALPKKKQRALGLL